MRASQITEVYYCGEPPFRLTDEAKDEIYLIGCTKTQMETPRPLRLGPNKDAQSRARLDPRSRFLVLPTELRLTIYEHALSEPFKLGIGGFYTHSSGKLPKIYTTRGEATKPALQPALTLVSSQLRQETLPLFYRRNGLILAVYYRKARGEVDQFLNRAATIPAIRANLWSVSIKHRFGILDSKATIEFEMRGFRILTDLWTGCVPPMVAREVEGIMNDAREAKKERKEDELLVVETLRLLVEVLGVSA